MLFRSYVTVQSSPAPQLTLNGNLLTCTTGAAGSFTYHWLENGVLLAGITDSFYQAVSGGVYKVVVTKALGCSSYTNDVVVNVSFAPDANFTASDTTICEGICVDYSDASVNFPSTWSWSFPGGNPNAATVNKALEQFADDVKKLREFEEYRLAYVAFTRAKRNLICSGAWFGQEIGRAHV